MKKKVYIMVAIVAGLLSHQVLPAQCLFPTISVYGAITKTNIVGESDSWKDPLGAQGGFIFDIYGLTSEISVVAEANISLQGANWEDDWGEGLKTGRTSLVYANIPLVVRYLHEKGFFGEIGIQPGFLLSAKDKYDDISYDFKDYISNFDLSIPIGIGYFLDDNLGIGLRVIPGLTNINSGEYESYKDRNLVIALRITYLIKKK